MAVFRKMEVVLKSNIGAIIFLGCHRIKYNLDYTDPHWEVDFQVYNYTNVNQIGS